MKSYLSKGLAAVALVSTLLASACSSSTPTPTPVPTATPLPTATATPPPTPTPPPSPTPTATSTSTPLPSPTATRTPRPPSTPTPAPSPTATPVTVKPVTYKNEIFGFSVDYPGDWTPNEGDVTAGDPVFVAQADAGLPRLLVDLAYAATLGAPKDMAGQVLDGLKRNVQQLQMLSEAPVTLADGTAAYEYGLEFPAGNVTLRGKLVVAPRGSQLFQVFAMTVKADYDGRLPQLDSITHSFRLQAPTPFGVTRQQALTFVRPSPGTLDPQMVGDINSAFYVAQVFSGLVSLDKNLQIVADLAESWEVQGNGTTYVFHLRQTAKFQSGKQVTAQDVKYSIERAAAPATGSAVTALYLNDIVGVTEKLAGTANQVSGVEVVDNSTVRITIKAPVPYFLAKLVHPVAFVLNQQNVTSGGSTWFTKPDGTGPFKVRGWEPGVVMALERNDSYYRGQPKLQFALIRHIGGDPLLMYQTGETDLAFIGADNISKVEGPSNPVNSQLQVTPELSITYVGFNTKQAPFDDPRARQAFAMAIDRDSLVIKDLGGTVEKATGILPKGMPGYNSKLAPIPFDASQAKTLWQQVLADKKLQLTEVKMLVPGFGTAIDTKLADMWQATLGVKVTFDGMLGNDYAASLARGGDHLYEFGWIADYPDPQNFLDVLFHGLAINNFGQYKNAQVDSLLVAARTEQTSQTRLQDYQQAEDLLIKDAAAIPLWYGRNYVLVQPYVKDWSLSALGIADLSAVQLLR